MKRNQWRQEWPTHRITEAERQGLNILLTGGASNSGRPKSGQTCEARSVHADSKRKDALAVETDVDLEADAGAFGAYRPDGKTQ